MRLRRTEETAPGSFVETAPGSFVETAPGSFVDFAQQRASATEWAVMMLFRRVLPDRTWLVTRRTAQRQFLLRPDAAIRQMYLYCLGVALLRFDVSLHAYVAMSNHSHLVVRDNHGNLPEFMAQFHKMVAKAINAYWQRTENFWASEPPNAVYLVGAEDRFAKLDYVHVNPVADHLVARALEWPGASSLEQHLFGRTLTITRPKGFFRASGPMPDEVEIPVAPVDGFEGLSQADWAERVARGMRAAEVKACELRAETGQVVLGPDAVLATSPTSHPTTIEARGGRIPHLACGDIERRKSELADLRNFRAAYREAMRRRQNGEADVQFPEGTYARRNEPGAVSQNEPGAVSVIRSAR
jgi:hypothetical protein